MDYKLFERVTKLDENGKRVGLKHTENPEYIDAMKSLIREFNQFVNRVVNEYNEEQKELTKQVKIVGQHNNWQNSGYYSPYFWNKVISKSKSEDEYGICIWFLLNNEGIRISVGTTGVLEEQQSKRIVNKINEFLFKELEGENLEGFMFAKDNKYTSFIYQKDDLHIDDFVKALNTIVPVYQRTVMKYDKNEFLDNNLLKSQRNVYIDEIKMKNILLYGVPGVGKTHNIGKLIRLIEEGRGQKVIFDLLRTNEKSEVIDTLDLEDRVSFVTFHQSFGYEDFIEGFRPNENGQIELVDGVFKRLCVEARENKEQNYYLVIDEINRGNISKIFGELITLIEEDKRDIYEVTLPYSKEKFSVPSNIYIIGTMNSTDKSIALIDVALRRRFTFLKMEPNVELIEYGKAKEIFNALNEKLGDKLDSEHLIGHSYFMNVESDEDLEFVIEYKIKPLLEEYFYGDNDGLDEILSVIA